MSVASSPGSGGPRRSPEVGGGGATPAPPPPASLARFSARARDAAAAAPSVAPPPPPASRASGSDAARHGPRPRASGAAGGAKSPPPSAARPSNTSTGVGHRAAAHPARVSQTESSTPSPGARASTRVHAATVDAPLRTGVGWVKWSTPSTWTYKRGREGAARMGARAADAVALFTPRHSPQSTLTCTLMAPLGATRPSTALILSSSAMGGAAGGGAGARGGGDVAMSGGGARVARGRLVGCGAPQKRWVHTAESPLQPPPAMLVAFERSSRCATPLPSRMGVSGCRAAGMGASECAPSVLRQAARSRRQRSRWFRSRGGLLSGCRCGSVRVGRERTSVRAARDRARPPTKI